MEVSTLLRSRVAARRHVGFTLVELLVVIAIVAVLASLAAPSFRSMIVKNAVNSAASSLQADLNYARSEALKRGLSVTACVSTSTIACSNSGNWENGWIVFVDRDANNARNTAVGAGEDLVRVYQATGETAFSITTTGGSAVKTIRFNRNGGSNAEGLKLSPSDASLSVGRAICIATTGRVRLTASGVESC